MSRIAKSVPPRPGSRQVAVESQKSVIAQAAMELAQRKYAPKTLKLILKIAAVNPSEAQIASQAGISLGALRYCYSLSRTTMGKPGGEIFDLTIDGQTERFHILFDNAVEVGWMAIEHDSFLAARGMLKEVLTDKGRVQYRYDPVLLALGQTGEAAYLLDKDGEPIPETKPLRDLEMMRWLLAHRFPERYGNKVQVDHTHKGGVLVIGVTKTSKELETTGPQTYKDIQEVEFEDVTEESLS